jgi:hypothetical protein
VWRHTFLTRASGGVKWAASCSASLILGKYLTSALGGAEPARVHPASVQWVPGAISAGVNWPGGEADRSSSAEVKNGGAILQIPHTFSWHSA